MTLRLAIVVSHPIPHFAPLHREASRLGALDVRVLFCCDWGVTAYEDPGFGATVAWDVPLLDGYAHEFLDIARRPRALRFWEVDNPRVGEALDRFRPHVVKVHGYAHRTQWRVAGWTRRRRVPLMLFSDSNAADETTALRRLAKGLVVGRFYASVDGALYVGDNNREYHLRFGIPRERLFPGALPIDAARLTANCPARSVARERIRQKHHLPADAFVVLLCGKLIERKRPLDLVLALAAARPAGRAPIWAVLMGEGSLRPAIEEIIRRKGLDNVVLTGFVNQSDISDYFVAADALAVTSSRDAHPLVITEAGLFGLPVVVSSAVGAIGSSDTAQPGVNALVYPCGDVDRLRQSLEMLATDEVLRTRMGEAGRTIAMTQDASAAARALAAGTEQLHRLGPRLK